VKGDEFYSIVVDRMAKIEKVLNKKELEYSKDDDRLYNFKRAARILNCTPEKALLGHLSKHLVSLLDIIENIKDYSKDEVKWICDERITDTINYLLLLEALIKERFNK